MTIIECIQNGNYVDLVALTKKHMIDRKLSNQEIGDRIDLSRSAISQYLSGTYGSNPKAIEDKLAAYLTEQGVVIDEDVDSFRPGEMFYQSADVRRIMAVCSACQTYSKMGVIAGKSGYGKTHTLLMYSKFPKVAYIECDETMGERDLVDTLARALGMIPSAGTSFQRTESIKEYLLKNPGYLIIVDEADKLISRSTKRKMEILRKFVKDSKINQSKPNVGIIFAGEPQLIPLLKNYNDRLDGRGTCWYELKGLSKKEAEDYLSRLPMAESIRDTLVSRACDARRGCFRRLDQTLDNIVRLMADKGTDTVTPEILTEASDMMMF